MSRKMTAMTVIQITATPPMTPPTMGAIGVEEGARVDVGVELEDVVVVVIGGGVIPAPYCVPTLVPLEPV